MAQWKKVLVSGSDIEVKNITASAIPSNGTSGDLVVVRTTDGGFKTVTQGSIQGTTTANFTLSGSTVGTVFDATQDILKFTGSNGATTVLSDAGTTTTVTFGVPIGTISQSAQITLADTNGFDTFSSSLATDIAANSASIASLTGSLTTLETNIADLEASASLIAQDSASIATALNSQTASITALTASVTSIQNFTGSVVTNAQTGSFTISSSVVGTTGEIDVTANGDQGVKIGLPTNVTIAGQLEANNLIIQGENVTETGVATISGSTQFGNALTNIHRFTGSVNITGALNIDNSGAGNDIQITNLATSNTALIGDIIVRDSATGKLHKAGTNIGTAISGAFGTLSGSFAQRISDIDTTVTTTNATDITALQNTSASLLASSSLGLHIAVGSAGSGLSLGESASFTAEGDGLTVEQTNTDAGVNVNYKIDPTALGAAMGTFSSSAQLQNILDDVYVQISDTPISGAEQLQALGFLTSSDFNSLQNIPSGLISGATDGTSPQGTIKINGNNVAIAGLGTSGDPTFNNVVISNNLTVTGTTTAFATEDLNIEDQFILINSGAEGNGAANDKDGGIIVDQGGGSGSLFMYDHDARAWGFVGAGGSNLVDYNDQSTSVTAVQPDVYVATVSASTAVPTDAPVYGVDSSTAKGQMHINSSDSTIWIYV